MDLIWVESAEHLGDFKLRVVFNNGVVKTVNLENQLDKPVFLPLKDVAFFKNFKLNPFTIEWENGADFAPEFLYSIGKQFENIE
jgi:hypothetical protein